MPHSVSGAARPSEFSSRKTIEAEVNLVNRASFSGEHRVRAGLEKLKLKLISSGGHHKKCPPHFLFRVACSGCSSPRS